MQSPYTWIFIIGVIVFFIVVVILLFFAPGFPIFIDDDFETANLFLEEEFTNLSEDSRLSYERARIWQEQHPPNSIPTEITQPQLVSIQEKGVSAFEFEGEPESNCFVAGRTELQFMEGENCIQTNLPLPRSQEVYYWETKIFDKPENTTISIGLATKPYPIWRLPGWSRYSVGYFSNDGYKYFSSPFNGKPFGLPYKQGDVIGVGYIHRTGTIFFTRNGRKIVDAYTGVLWNLFPTIGANGPCEVHVNLGQMGFVFIEANVKEWGLAPSQGTLSPPPAYGTERDSVLLAMGTTSSDEHQHTCINLNGIPSSQPPAYSTG